MTHAVSSSVSRRAFLRQATSGAISAGVVGPMKGTERSGSIIAKVDLRHNRQPLGERV